MEFEAIERNSEVWFGCQQPSSSCRRFFAKHARQINCQTLILPTFSGIVHKVKKSPDVDEGWQHGAPEGCATRLSGKVNIPTEVRATNLWQVTLLLVVKLSEYDIGRPRRVFSLFRARKSLKEGLKNFVQFIDCVLVDGSLERLDHLLDCLALHIE